MLKESNKKVQKKLKIKELALIATEKINENKILLENISLYQLKIDGIKSMLNKKNKNENSEIKEESNSTEIKTNEDTSENNYSIKNEFEVYYKQLKNFVENLKETNKKLLRKYENNINIIFDESSLDNINLGNYRNDNFILYYDLPPKNDIIKRLTENIINSRRHSVFREFKRENLIRPDDCENYINNENLYLQRDLQIECKHYNKCINKIKKKVKNFKKIQQSEKCLKEIIDYFQKEKKIKLDEDKSYSIFNKKKNKEEKNNKLSFSSNKKKSINNKRKNNMKNNNYNSITIDELGKKYQFENDFMEYGGGSNNDQTYLPNQGGINKFLFDNDFENDSNEKEKKKEKGFKKKFNFQTLDELFDIYNEESEKEVIIHDELHSDDEVVFEKKIKNKVRINTMYLQEIKKKVPNLYLNQIEFNKKKIMNDADLYSYQRREYFKQNIDENIKLLRKRIKKLKKRLANNKEKLEAFIAFDKKMQEKYEVLKPLKVQNSLKDYNISFMRKEFYNFRNKKYDIIDEVDEKNYENEEKKNDDYDENDEDVDDYSDEMRKRNKNKYNKNKVLMTEVNDEEGKYDYGKMYENDDNKPKSK